MSALQHEFEQLLEEVIEERISDEHKQRFDSLLRENAEFLRDYVGHLRMHSMLTWRSGSVVTEPSRKIADANPPVRVEPRFNWLRWTIAALIVISATLAITGTDRLNSSPVAVASVIETDGVVWTTEQYSPGSRLSAKPLQISSGRMKILFDQGAVVEMSGPLSIEIIDANNIRALRGKLTARVENVASGFTVLTPSASVIDRGTEFGVNVHDQGETDVIVFKGIVDITPKQKGAESTTRLTQGDGVRVGLKGRLSRLDSLQRSVQNSDWSQDHHAGAVITSVQDNLQEEANNKCYQIVLSGLVDGAPAYVDRNFVWKGKDRGALPQFLRGADLVMTFNDDKRRETLQLQITVECNALLYLFIDDRFPPPAWLLEEFSNTGHQIGMEENEKTFRLFNVWERRVHAGKIILGANHAKSMYGIAAITD